MKRVMLFVAVVLLWAGGCGGGGNDGAKRLAGGSSPASNETGGPQQGGSSATGSNGAATTVPPGGPGDAPGGRSGAPGGSDAPPTEDPGPGPKPIALTAELATACVRPGTTQTIVIKTEPATDVSYNATYADGKTAWSPDHYGGAGQGVSGPNGEFRETFLVKPGAPAGAVKVDVVGSNNAGINNTSATFKVADATGKC